MPGRSRKSSPGRAAPRLHPLRRIHEDDDVLVVEKPAGLLTSTGPHDRRPTALAIVRGYLSAQPAARCGLVHRLDKDASGLLVFSKNERAYRNLKDQFFQHSVLRIYLAVTRSVPNPRQGRVDVRLIERADGTVMAATGKHAPGRDRGEPAVTQYWTVRDNGVRAAVVVKLHTGRKHQIRVHLLSRAGGILNDPLYHPRHGSAGAATRAMENARLMLAALVLGFAHPASGQPKIFELAAPREFPLVGGAAMRALTAEVGVPLDLGQR